MMTYLKKTDARGRNLPRVCYVTGHGLNNQRYGSFWEFWQARGLTGDHIADRTSARAWLDNGKAARRKAAGQTSTNTMDLG